MTLDRVVPSTMGWLGGETSLPSKSDWIKALPTTCQVIRGEATEAFSHKPLPGFSTQASKQALRTLILNPTICFENWYKGKFVPEPAVLASISRGEMSLRH